MQYTFVWLFVSITRKGDLFIPYKKIALVHNNLLLDIYISCGVMMWFTTALAKEDS